MGETEISKAIKNLRMKTGLTQEQLGRQINVDRTTIAKWEKGANTPQFPDLVELIQRYDLDLREAFPMIKITRKDTDTMVEGLAVQFKNKAKTIEYYGKEETVAGFMAYYEDYINYVMRSLRDFENQEKEIVELEHEKKDDEFFWNDLNSFIVLLNKNSMEINGIRDFGKHCPTPGMFMFSTPYIPLGFHEPPKESSLEEVAKDAKSLLEKECAEAIKEAEVYGKRPLFLFDHLAFNNYSAWSLKEDKKIYVCNFKNYRKEFKLIDASNKEVIKNQDYMVITPSNKLIDLIGLNLEPEIWERKMSWDIWEEREEKVGLELKFLKKDEVEIYNTAIELINKSRKQEIRGMSTEYSNLEHRVESFEKLVQHFDASASSTFMRNKFIEHVARTVDDIRQKEDDIRQNEEKTNELLRTIFGEYE